MSKEKGSLEPFGDKAAEQNSSYVPIGAMTDGEALAYVTKGKIDAIRLVRMRLNLSLLDTRTLVEADAVRRNITHFNNYLLPVDPMSVAHEKLNRAGTKVEQHLGDLLTKIGVHSSTRDFAVLYRTAATRDRLYKFHHELDWIDSVVEHGLPNLILDQDKVEGAGKQNVEF